MTDIDEAHQRGLVAALRRLRSDFPDGIVMAEALDAGIAALERQWDMSEGAEIDREVAEKVMGWSVGPRPGKNEGDDVDWCWYNAKGPKRFHDWSPSTRINHAWEVLEWLKANGHNVTVGNESETWECLIFDASPPYRWEAEADTALLAICRAALAAVKDQPQSGGRVTDKHEILEALTRMQASRKNSISPHADEDYQAVRQFIERQRVPEITDVLAWADGVTGALGTEYADRVTDKEARIAYAVLVAAPEPDDS